MYIEYCAFHSVKLPGGRYAIFTRMPPLPFPFENLERLLKLRCLLNKDYYSWDFGWITTIKVKKLESYYGGSSLSWQYWSLNSDTIVTGWHLQCLMWFY
jgi:hypothetical protein